MTRKKPDTRRIAIGRAEFDEATWRELWAAYQRDKTQGNFPDIDACFNYCMKIGVESYLADHEEMTSEDKPCPA